MSDIQDTDNFFEDFGLPFVSIIGCGSAGSNIIHELSGIRRDHINTIAIDTDKQHIDSINADRKILVDRSLTGSEDMIKDALVEADLAFIIADIESETGTNMVPAIARLAKDNGSFVVCFVNAAAEGIDKLAKIADRVIVLDNGLASKLNHGLQESHPDQYLSNVISFTIKNIVQNIFRPSMICMDVADFKSVLKGGGLAGLLFVEVNRHDGPEAIAKRLFDHALMKINHGTIDGAFFCIVGGSDNTLSGCEKIISSITSEFNPSTNIIWGFVYDGEFKDNIRIIAIFTIRQ